MALSRFVSAVTATAILVTARTSTIMEGCFASAYHPSTIGTPGQAWGDKEYKLWRDTREKQRCYLTEVVPKVEALQLYKTKNKGELLFDVFPYGVLAHEGDGADPSEFPLLAVRSRQWCKDKPSVLVTGGVHGYETSGVEGALLFLSDGLAEHYSQHFNLLVLPCVSPWGFERIQRWTAKGTDPNRSFNPDGEIVAGRSFNPEAATDESAALIHFLREDMKHVTNWICHIDLHETTDTDETEFRPAKEARDGLMDGGKAEIPDGFYLVQDETSRKPEWFTAMIDAVRKVTHIAPADANGDLIGSPMSQEGVVVIPNNRILGLCAGVTSAPYRTTTEVYPDSPNATPQQCNQAQVACIEGALEHILSVEQQLCTTVPPKTT